VTSRELQWASAQAEQLAHRLSRMCTELEHLSALKAALELQH
jgi:hypothetical protein